MRLSVPAGKNEKASGLSAATVGRFSGVVALSGELFDAIEVNAARTGNHKRAAVRMSRLAAQATPVGISRAEAHVRAGEQWLLADEPDAAVDEFRIAIADAGPTFDDPRVPLARAMFALGRGAEVRTCEFTNYCEALDQKHKEVTCQLWDRLHLDAVGALRSSDGKRRLVAPDWPG